MGHREWLLAGLVALAVAGCASGPPFIQAAEPEALHNAQRRAQFEFNCPSVTVEPLSQEMVQSPLQYTRFAPPQRAEYTIGASGCGQRRTYLVVCTDGGGCVAVGGR